MVPSSAGLMRQPRCSATLPVRFCLEYLEGELYPGDVLVAGDLVVDRPTRRVRVRGAVRGPGLPRRLDRRAE